MGPPLSPIHPVVKLSEREEAPSYKKCLEDLDVGLCNDAITRWYYDHKVRRCKPFTYRGCSGNRNHFYSNESCQEHCERFSDVIERSRIEPDADTYKAIDSTSTSVENFTEAPAESVSKEQWTSSVKPSGYSGTIRSSRVPEIYGIASPMKRGYAQADVGLERVMLSSYPSEPQPALLSQVYFYPAEQLKGANSVMRNVRLCPIGEQPVKTADNNLIRCLPGQNHCPPNAVCYYYGLDFCCCSQSLVRPMARP
ncbi:Kunitz/Bovine pancreatic trypsin inhibitor domain protein [Trichuris suis]|nr:Kunitz/Bovine pancreatic trypsin inhibitor domain protein [Trichuris suis]